jgi:tetratricopeptide (TPR) repeat protein
MALVVLRETSNRRGEGIVLGNLAAVKHEIRRFDEARVDFLAALAIAREVGDRPSIGHVLGNLGIVLRDLGRMDESRQAFEQAVGILRALLREAGDVAALARLLCSRACLELDEGALEAARAAIAEARSVAIEVATQPESALAKLLADVEREVARAGAVRE